MPLMKLSIRIPLGLTIAVVLIGVTVFIRHLTKGLPLPTTTVVIWAVAAVILGAITEWSWQRYRGK
jgi:hypothetical protein